MYAKILKETASQLTLLSVESDLHCRESIDKNLSRFFKEITHVSTSQEVWNLYRIQKFDLILMDIDTLGDNIYQCISTLQKHDPFQAITAISTRSDDSKLLLNLLNSHFSGFITKPSTPDQMYKVLSKVSEQVYDRKILLHYLEVLEGYHDAAINVSCRSGCPMKAELKPIHEIKIVQPSKPEVAAVEEDDFFFFPEPSLSSLAESVDISLYQDYFSFLEHDDREELNDQLGDIDACLLNAFDANGGDCEYIARLGNSLMRYGNVLLHYQFFSDMGTSILEFGKTISDNSEMIAERSSDFQMLISGFCSGLQTYMSEVWEKESENPKFFNDSIINDATTIMWMVAPPKASDGDDDLFFF
jgi:CheY-like chemotaxis protein